MSASGTIAFAGDGRDEVASAIAGAMAEAGIPRLEVSDPRTCRGYTLAARESDLPRTLLEAVPGTTIAGNGIALLIDHKEIRWVAEERLGASLRAITIP